MAVDLATSATMVQVTLTAYMVGFGAGQYVIGALSDRWGRRSLIIWGTGLAAVSSIAASLSPSIEILWCARLLQGVGAAAGVVLARAIVADVATGLRLAQQLSVMMVIQGVAPIAAPLLGSLLASSIGWRGIMIALAALSVVLLIPMIRIIRETLPLARRTAAPLGRVLAAPVKVLGIARFSFTSLSITAAYGILFAYISGSSFILQNVFSLDSAQYGFTFAINAVVMSVGSAINARLVARWSPRVLARTGLCLVAVGTIVTFVDTIATPTLVIFVSSVALATLGLSLVLDRLDNPLNLFVYALGYAVGISVGILIEDKLALGYIMVTTILPTSSTVEQHLPLILR